MGRVGNGARPVLVRSLISRDIFDLTGLNALKLSFELLKTVTPVEHMMTLLQSQGNRFVKNKVIFLSVKERNQPSFSLTRKIFKPLFI